MRFALTGGGTAGHVYPALALASELASQGHEVEFAGAPGSLEERLATQNGYTFTAFRASGFDRARPLSLVTAAYQVFVSSLRTWGWLGQRGIDGVVGFGGYISIPLGLGALLRGVPLVIHEQNSVPGLANRLLSRWARSLCITYPESATHFPPSSTGRIVHTGNPVRAELLNASRAAGRATLGIPDDATVVLVFGGSRGARHLNEVMVSLGTEVLALGNTYVVHSAGPAEYDSVSEQVRDRQLDPHRYRVVAYIEDMGNVMAATDLAICRAGATSIAELTALGVGAVLVPYPYATDDHQTKNATAMVQHGAAVSFADTAIAGSEFRETVLSIASSPERRASMAVAAAKLGRRDAAQRLAAAVLDSVR